MKKKIMISLCLVLLLGIVTGCEEKIETGTREQIISDLKKENYIDSSWKFVNDLKDQKVDSFETESYIYIYQDPSQDYHAIYISE